MKILVCLGKAWGSARLTSLSVILMLLVQGPHFLRSEELCFLGKSELDFIKVADFTKMGRMLSSFRFSF